MSTTSHMLQQVLVDGRGMPKAALDSIRTTFASLPMQVIMDARAPSLTAGNIWLQRQDAILVCWLITADAFMGYLRENSLLPNTALLAHTRAPCYMIVVGQLSSTPDGAKAIVGGKETNFAWKAVQGARRDIQQMGVTLIELPREQDVGDWLTWLAESDLGPKRLTPLREGFFPTHAEQILAGFPGLGEMRVDKLLEQAGNAANALVLLTDLSLKLPGIPKSVQVEARKILGIPDDLRMGFDLIDSNLTMAELETA